MVCCHEIREVEVFHLKGKIRLFWNLSDLEDFAKFVENNCEGNDFLVE